MTPMIKGQLGLSLSFLRGNMSRLNLLPFTATYSKKILSIASANLVGYWPQNEPAGSVSFDGSGKNHHGAYTGVTFGSPGVPGMGFTAPTYDGTNDYNNIYSTSLNTAFNGAEGAMVAWAKVSAAEVWTNGVDNYALRFAVDSNNQILFALPTTNSQITYFYRANGTIQQVLLAGQSSTDWMCLFLTWSKSGDAVKAYLGGEQQGATQTGLDTWAGDLSAQVAVIGASITTPSSVWPGPIGPVALWNTPITANQIAYLSKV